MPPFNIIQAVQDALQIAMRADPKVVVLGEDVGKFGGVFRATVGLQEEFGDDRVIDTPLNECGIVGTAIGMALYGLRPVVEIQFSDFIYPAYDQIVNELAKYRYRSGGQFPCPLVIRTPFGGGIRGGHYHSQSPEAVFAHHAGLVVVAPSNPYDAKGLLLEAVHAQDPVMVFEPKRVYRGPDHGTNWTGHPLGEVPAGAYRVPFGVARQWRPRRGVGTAVTVVSYAAMVHVCERAAVLAEADGLDVEVIDLRSLVPWDVDAVCSAVRRTGRCVVVNEAPRTCGFAAEVAATVGEQCFDWLLAPVGRVTGFDTPFPYTLEHLYLPDPARVLDAVRSAAHYA
ncbi:MAG: alpha-ketoacid dehydrogenase subunit beta [Myxococcales bacterium]|nr:alpha-ketoacid dehydrogenase subunit beta [Myxococcales bacterium]